MIAIARGLKKRSRSVRNGGQNLGKTPVFCCWFLARGESYAEPPRPLNCYDRALRRSHRHLTMNTAVAAAGLRLKGFRDVWLISAGHGLTHWYTATFYLLLPLIGKELGLSYTEIGLIMTIQHLAGAISNLPGGMIVDIVGQKGYLMAASLFWVGVPYALMSVTHNFWMLLVCVTLVGIGNNIWHPAAIPTLAHRYPQRKGLVLSFHGMGGNMGEAIA